MIRVINLKDYLPPYIVNYKELNQILEVENARLQNLEVEHWQLVDNRFIQSCDEAGISRFERMIGIVPLSDDTLDDRKFRVITRWNKTLPYNYEYLHNQLEILCGKDGFRIELEGLNLRIFIGIESRNMFRDVEFLVDAIIPVNVVTEVIQLYNKYEALENCTYKQLAQFTYNELRQTEFYRKVV